MLKDHLFLHLSHSNQLKYQREMKRHTFKEFRSLEAKGSTEGVSPESECEGMWQRCWSVGGTTRETGELAAAE